MYEGNVRTSIEIVNGQPSSPRTRTGSSDDAVWLLYGLPPHESYDLFDETDGDAVWYANMFHAYMTENIDDRSLALINHVENGIYTMLDLLHNEVDDPEQYEPSGFPGGMLTVVRFNEEDDTLEYFTIGDTVILLEDVDGNTRRICAADGSRHKPSFSPDNQWCLSFDPNVLSYARYGTIPAEDLQRVLLTTTAVDSTFASTETETPPLQTHLQRSDGNVSSIVSTAEDLYDSSLVPRSNGSDVIAAGLLFVR